MGYEGTPSRDIVENKIDEQGWSDDAVIELLCEFIDLNEMQGALAAFLGGK